LFSILKTEKGGHKQLAVYWQ